MRVSVIGTGYVGLVTGACLAEVGHEVVCVDLSTDRVAQVNAGVAPFFEPGLPELLSGVALTATTDLAEAVRSTDITLIAVGTPFDGKAIDLSYVEKVAEQIGVALRDKDEYHVVVVKSTVVPGTTEQVVLPLLEQHSGKRAGADFGVGMNPEFLSEGTAVEDFRFPDRIVIGGIDSSTWDVMAELYAPWADAPLLKTTPAAAEMIKYASNAFQATLISFSNELANLASAVGGVDIVDVQKGLHLSELIAGSPVTAFLKAGCGFGGSCFPKDLAALAAFGEAKGVPMAVTSAVLQVNKGQPGRILELIQRHHASLDGLQVTVLGAAFKAGTDDLRESPYFPIAAALKEAGAKVRVFDPVARPADADLALTLADALSGAQVVVLVTAWPEFAEVPDLLREVTPQPLVIDGRRMWQPEMFARYEAIGR